MRCPLLTGRDGECSLVGSIRPSCGPRHQRPVLGIRTTGAESLGRRTPCRSAATRSKQSRHSGTVAADSATEEPLLLPLSGSGISVPILMPGFGAKRSMMRRRMPGLANAFEIVAQRQPGADSLGRLGTRVCSGRFALQLRRLRGRRHRALATTPSTDVQSPPGPLHELSQHFLDT